MHGTHLVRHASAPVTPNIVVVGVDVEVPFVHEIDALPEIVGRMAVEGVGHEGSLLQVGAGQEAEYELEQLGRKTPNLGCWSVELPQVQGAIAAAVWQCNVRERLLLRRSSCWQGVVHAQHADSESWWVGHERVISGDCR